MPELEGTLRLEGARVLYNNFGGVATQFNDAGNHNFDVVIPEELVPELLSDGWNIKVQKSRPDEPDFVPKHYLNVTIKYRNRDGKPRRTQPRVVMMTSCGYDERATCNPKKRTRLEEEDLGVLDEIEIDYIDVLIEPYNWTMNGNTGVKAQAKSLFVFFVEDPLEAKYAEPEDEE